MNKVRMPYLPVAVLLTGLAAVTMVCEEADAESDIGIGGIVAPAGSVAESTEVTPEVVVANHRESEVTCDVRLTIVPGGGDDGYDLTETGIAVAANSTVTHQFRTPWIAAPTGSYEVTAWTILDRDADPGNDTARSVIEVTRVDWSEFNERTIEGSLDALADADSIYVSTMASQGMGAAAEATRAYLEGHATVARVGIQRDSSVTVFFENGLLGAIYELDRGTRESLDVFMPPQVPARISGGGEVIASAVVLTPFAHSWGKVAEDWVAGQLDTCFGGMSGATQRFSNTQVTVEKVEDVLTAGPGVLLWSSHGALIFKDHVNWDDWVVLLTGETYPNAQMAQRIINNYEGGARASGDARELVVIFVKGKPYLAVTPTFVRNHGNFDYMEGMGSNAAKSLVYVCCCYSGMIGGGMAEAFWAAGVDVYMGWSESVKALFAAERQILFFRSATDTCTTLQAYYGIGNVTDPWRGAQLLHYPTDSVMIRAQMRFSKDGTALRGYSVGVAMASGVTTVSCFASPPMQEPQYGVTVHFPGVNAGSWNCTSDDDAVIALTEFTSGKLFIVQKNYVGVNGSIDVGRYDENIISGRFSGKLGRWSIGQNPEEDPPVETIEIRNGIFKHVGLRQ